MVSPNSTPYKGIKTHILAHYFVSRKRRFTAAIQKSSHYASVMQSRLRSSTPRQGEQKSGNIAFLASQARGIGTIAEIPLNRVFPFACK